MRVQVVDCQDKQAPKKFADSLRYTGFAVLKNHSVDTALISRTFDNWRSFFERDEAEKNVYHFEKVLEQGFAPEGCSSQAGYFPFSTSEKAKDRDIKDLKEFYQFFPWGPVPEMVKEKTYETSAALKSLAASLLQWIQDNTPDEVRDRFSMPLPKMIKNDDAIVLRILYYPEVKDEDRAMGAVRAAPHGDIDLLTLLPFSDQPGLQVRDANGNWYDVPSEPGMICVNIGDMLDLASQGYYPSTLHRVVNPDVDKNVPRLAMPFFVHASPDVRLSEKHTSDSFLQERLGEQGLSKAKAA